MRIAPLAALVVACAAPPAARYVTIGSDAVADARATAEHDHARFAVVEVDGDRAIVEVDAGELDALSARMHASFDRCGGFMVHDSLADARRSAAERGGVEYTIDRPAVVRAVLPAIDEARILATIRELSAMPTRYYQSESGAAASTWLRDRWRGFTTRDDVTIELFDHGYAQKSVVLTIPGTTRASEVVVIGGHLDSISMRGRGAPAPGADDDASGIATLDEVLRALLASDYRPARTIKFIAYAAEEVGLRGSLAIVKEFERRGIDVVGVLQLDMTNYRGSDRDIWLVEDYTSKAQNDYLAALDDKYVGASLGRTRCGYACSDHASWQRAGIPASMPFESRANQRNTKIHTAGDTLEVSGDNAAHAVKFARLAAAYAIELGKGELGAAASATPTPAPDGSPHRWWLVALAAAVVAIVLRARRRAK